MAATREALEEVGRRQVVPVEVPQVSRALLWSPAVVVMLVGEDLQRVGIIGQLGRPDGAEKSRRVRTVI